jgi:hypothetical protein
MLCVAAIYWAVKQPGLMIYTLGYGFAIVRRGATRVNEANLTVACREDDNYYTHLLKELSSQQKR